VFNWGVERALIPASPCINVKKPTRELPRHRYYTDAELGAIKRALTESIMDDAIRLTLWTGVRIEQALGAAWSEFTLPRKEDGTPDIARCVWMIPADRTGNKSGVPWAVPLVAAAVDVLVRRRRLDGESAFVFGVRTRDGGDGRAWRSQDAIYEIRQRSGIADFRPHDLRRTLSTWLASRAGGAEPQPVRDAILGHRPPRLEGTYNVHSYEAEKRAALERWAAHVERLRGIAEVAAAS
jgi:integrase